MFPVQTNNARGGRQALLRGVRAAESVMSHDGG